MIRVVLIWILSFFFLQLGAHASQKENNKLSRDKYILILSSYTYENSWGTSVAKKIQENIEKEHPDLLIRIVYGSLESRRTMLSSRLSMQGAFANARVNDSILVPRILVLVGDESWMLYRIMNLRGHWEKVPVILCGVSNKVLKDYSDFFTSPALADTLFIPVEQSSRKLPITGVMKNEHGREAITLIKRVYPDLKKIIYSSTGTYNDENAFAGVKRAMEQYFPTIQLEYSRNFSREVDSVGRIMDRKMANTVLLFNTCPDFLDSLQIPAFSLRDPDLKHPALLGGYYSLLEEYALQAANMVEKVYHGVPVGQIPFQYVRHERNYLSMEAAHYWDIYREVQEFKDIVPIYMPQSFWMQNLRYILLTLLGIVLSVITVVIYCRSVQYRKEIKLSLLKYKELYDKFQVIYENMPVGLLLFDNQGKLLRKNKGSDFFKRLLTLEEEDTFNLFENVSTGHRLAERIRKKELINQILVIRKGNRRGKVVDAQDSDCHYVRMIIRYLPNEYTDFEDILMILIDNSAIYKEKIALKKVYNVFHFAMDASSVGVAEYNLLDGKGITTNSWCENLNMPKNITVVSDVYRYIVDDDREKIQCFLEEVKAGRCTYFLDNLRVRRKQDSSVHWLRYLIKVVEYNPEHNRIILAELSQNMDEQKEKEKELYEAMKKIRESERLKNTFVANMSHEIRTPLNAIVGFSNLLAVADDLSVRREMMHQIEENNETLLRLIHDIIDLSKIESGTMDFLFSEVDVNSVFEDIVAITRLKVRGRELDIIYKRREELFSVITDKVRLKQVITNFVSNALKFTEQGSITLGYQFCGNILYGYVTDTGIGISAEEQEKIFNRFFKADKTYRGYGLGLAISYSVVTELGGEIGVESEKGKGSTFWFKLPVQKVARKERVRRLYLQQENGEVKKPRILVLEEDRSSFLLLQFILKEDCEIMHAWNEAATLEFCRNWHPDLVVMDVKMSGKDDYWLLHEVRQVLKSVPIIATTAYILSKEEEKILRAGFNAYLSKPLNRKEVLEVVAHWLTNNTGLL